MFLFDLFNMEAVYIGYSIEELSKVINVLLENDIKYKEKVVRHLKSDEMFSLQKVGVNMDYETQYTVSVKQKDYEEAKYFVNKILYP